MHEIEIKKGSVSKDHVHLFVSAPPNMAASEIMRRIKGRSSRKLFEIFPELKKRYWGKHFYPTLRNGVRTHSGKRIFLCNIRSNPRDDNELY